jgi:deoxyribodipyrimidine photo-lyase
LPPVPAIRIRACNRARLQPNRQYVLYWMTACRRLHFNFALDRAIEYCRKLQKPLLLFEALRCDYPWASDRFHRFILGGMAENPRHCQENSITYFPYVEPAPHAARGLLESLAAQACLVVTDDYPSFFLPRMLAAASKKLSVLLEAVDSNGLLPLRAAEQVFSRAFDFRRFLQKNLPAHFSDLPAADPVSNSGLLAGAHLSKTILFRWPATPAALLEGSAGSLEKLSIDHSVRATAVCGGHASATQELKNFVAKKLDHYDENRNQPELEATRNLSPYLHFGHISAHEIFLEITKREKWNPAKVALRSSGSREGWWNMSKPAEAFFDQLITWRELGFNFSSHREDYAQFESLPGWVQKTLKSHLKDQREHTYTLKQFESAQTHDPLWNAAQTQLAREGKIHNYLRMLWGKKILEWTRSPKDAASIMIRLNDKYSLDGRDPNSYSGIFWVLGRYDRPWGPERPVFGLVRYMSCENTARKYSVKDYIRKYSAGAQSPLKCKCRSGSNHPC